MIPFWVPLAIEVLRDWLIPAARKAKQDFEKPTITAEATDKEQVDKHGRSIPRSER